MFTFRNINKLAIDDIDRDRLLFRRIAGGDAFAFEKIFEIYSGTLLNNAIKFLKSDFWAEEITQEVFLQLWDNRHTIAAIENPAGWLYKSIAYKCIDRLRKDAIELRAQYAMNQSLTASNTAELENRHDQAALKMLISEAVSQLPEQQRKAFILKNEQSLSYKEIAERLGISHHTVRNHLIRAYESIRQHVLTHGEFLALTGLFFKNLLDR